jgi:hypothetical protein
MGIIIRVKMDFVFHPCCLSVPIPPSLRFGAASRGKMIGPGGSPVAKQVSWFPMW